MGLDNANFIYYYRGVASATNSQLGSFMKIPYVKLYTADLLAASRYLTSQQIGDAILALCESAFENDTAYTPDTAREEALFNMLLDWKEEAKRAYKHNKKMAQKAARARWEKQAVSGGAPSILRACATSPCQTETETKTETETEPETETENNLSLNLPLYQEEEKQRDFWGGNSSQNVAACAGQKLQEQSP